MLSRFAVHLSSLSSISIAFGFMSVGAIAGCQILAGLTEDLPSGDGGTARDGSASIDGARIDGASTSSRYANEVLSDAPVLYLRFSEASGARIADSAGGSALVASGSARRGRPALIKNDPDPSIGLGQGAEVLLDAKFDYSADTPFTWELWVKLDEAGVPFDNLMNGPPNLLGTNLYFQDNQLPYIGLERWSGDLVRFVHFESPTLVPVAGRVFHVVIVNDKTKIWGFVNGAKQEGRIGPSKSAIPAASIALGRVRGDYDEVAIYDKALPDARVLAHYAAGVD